MEVLVVPWKSQWYHEEPNSIMEDLCRETQQYLGGSQYYHGGAMEDLYRGPSSTIENLVVPWRTCVRPLKDLATVRSSILLLGSSWYHGGPMEVLCRGPQQYNGKLSGTMEDLCKAPKGPSNCTKEDIIVSLHQGEWQWFKFLQDNSWRSWWELSGWVVGQWCGKHSKNNNSTIT